MLTGRLGRRQRRRSESRHLHLEAPGRRSLVDEEHRIRDGGAKSPAEVERLRQLEVQLDQYWDLAPEPVLKQIRQVLATNKQPLAREAASDSPKFPLIAHTSTPRPITPRMIAVALPAELLKNRRRASISQPPITP